jgi:hypothetical protein
MYQKFIIHYTGGKVFVQYSNMRRRLMENITLYGIEYYKKSVFKGSYRGMCFRIGKREDKENPETPPVLAATAWKGPYILEKTEEEPLVREFPFTEEGLREAEEWLTQTQKLLA